MNDFNELFREQGYGHGLYLATLSALMQCFMELSKIMPFREKQILLKLTDVGK